MNNKALRIVIVDDHLAFSERLMKLLQTLPGVDVVGRASDLDSGRTCVAALQPDVAIVDIRLRNASGFEILAEMKRKWPEMIALMVTAYADSQYARRSRQLGADFFFEKSSGIKALLDAIKHLRDGTGLPIMAARGEDLQHEARTIL
ncbi:MAG TPA: response regulator transcription factor [Elusimicrobiota bacterium]|nr:response regulator transcription factor [Elusimicrobiota bacterium]